MCWILLLVRSPALSERRTTLGGWGKKEYHPLLPLPMLIVTDRVLAPSLQSLHCCTVKTGVCATCFIIVGGGVCVRFG